MSQPVENSAQNKTVDTPDQVVSTDEESTDDVD